MLSFPSSLPPKPLGSGFGHDSTANDVLAGIDLTGRFALVTGGYSGLGLEMTRALSSAGADVLVPARRPEVAYRALADVARARIARLDLTDPAAVARFSAEAVERDRPVDLVIAAAGIMRTERLLVGPGWESHLAVHHLGHFALVAGLDPVLAEGCRVVGLSSAGHFLADIRWDDPHYARTADWDRWAAYGQSKTAVALWALHLDGRLASRGGHAFAVHPGSILTPLQREVSRGQRRELGWLVGPDDEPAPGFKTAEQGAATAAWAATSPLLESHGGAYLQDCDVAAPATSEDMLAGGVKPWALDRAAAERLWHLSRRWIGLSR